MENKLFTDARRLKYVLDMCVPYDNANCFGNSLASALIGDSNSDCIMEMALKSEKLGFDSLAITTWCSDWMFNNVVKEAIERYNLKVVYFGSRATDFVEDLEKYFKLGFHVEGISTYKESRTVTRKVLKLIR